MRPGAKYAGLRNSTVDAVVVTVAEMVGHEVAGIYHLVETVEYVGDDSAVVGERSPVFIDFQPENMVILVAGSIVDVIGRSILQHEERRSDTPGNSETRAHIEAVHAR